MASLSQHFLQAARRHFQFLNSEFGFSGPEVRQTGWQSTTVYYLRGSVAIAIGLDNEESTLVTFELWEGPARAEPVGNDSRRFGVTSLARFRDPSWPPVGQERPLTRDGIDDALAHEASALQAHGGDVLAGRLDKLAPFMDAQAEWLRGHRDSLFPPP